MSEADILLDELGYKKYSEDEKKLSINMAEKHLE